MTKELISEYTCKPFTLWNVPKAYSVECIRFFFQMYVCMYVHRYICMQEYVFYLRCNYVHVRVKERRGVERVCVFVLVIILSYLHHQSLSSMEAPNTSNSLILIFSQFSATSWIWLLSFLVSPCIYWISFLLHSLTVFCFFKALWSWNISIGLLFLLPSG